MNLTLKEAELLLSQIKTFSKNQTDVEVVVCPPFTALSLASGILRGSWSPAGRGVRGAESRVSPRPEAVGRIEGSIGLGAQDVFWEKQGAFTGEVSAAMLRDAGCQFVIIGHSERRTYFGETDESVRRKLSAAIAHQLIPIVCIGETLAERDANKTFNILERQLNGAFAEPKGLDISQVVLAYEPVWAIGTGRNATPEQAQEAHSFIRQWVLKHCGPKVSESIRIQYGGSVTALNALSLLQQNDVDGALVGGASLKADSFSAIVKAAIEAKTVARH